MRLLLTRAPSAAKQPCPVDRSGDHLDKSKLETANLYMQQIPLSMARDFEVDLPELQGIRRELFRAKSRVNLRFHREIHQTRSMRNDRLEAPLLRQQQGVMVEVFHEGVLSYAGTADVSAAGVQQAIEKAQATAEALSAHALVKFPDSVRPGTSGVYRSPHLQSLKSLHTSTIDDLLSQANKALAVAPEITQRQASVELIETESWNLSNGGEDRRQKFAYWVLDGSATAERGTEVQTRSLNGSHSHCYQGGAENLNMARILTQCKKSALEAVELLSAENCPTGHFDLILSPDQMLLQIHESIGHPLELDRILGDERNYAGWSFVKLEDFGQLQYGSPILNVSFDPTIQNEFASYGYDDCGLVAKRELLIEKGILKRGLGSLESQTRAKVPGVANFRSASWNRAPIDRMANLNVEPGTTSLKEMMAMVEDGIMMSSNRSWSIDDYRDKFQFGCEVGYRIKNGQITGLVKNPNYRGRTLDFWRCLKAVGDRESFEVYGSPYCGKGEPSQVIRVGHASPSCLFEKTQCFGGGL